MMCAGVFIIISVSIDAADEAVLREAIEISKVSRTDNKLKEAADRVVDKFKKAIPTERAEAVDRYWATLKNRYLV